MNRAVAFFCILAIVLLTACQATRAPQKSAVRGGETTAETGQAEQQQQRYSSHAAQLFMLVPPTTTPAVLDTNASETADGRPQAAIYYDELALKVADQIEALRAGLAKSATPDADRDMINALMRQLEQARLNAASMRATGMPASHIELHVGDGAFVGNFTEVIGESRREGQGSGASTTQGADTTGTSTASLSATTKAAIDAAVQAAITGQGTAEGGTKTGGGAAVEGDESDGESESPAE